MTRIGLALTHPRWALAVAGDRRHAGRSGSDLIVVCFALVLATQVRALFAAGWMATAIDGRLGLRALSQILTQTLALDLAFLLVGAFGLWIAAGPRRSLGRAFDLACSAALPLFVVDIAFTTVLRGFGVDRVPGPLVWVFTGVAWGWTGALFALALRQAKVASSKIPMPPAPVAALGRRAGLGVLAVAALGLAIQIGWLAGHYQELRPVRDGDVAPRFALPTILANGEPGPIVDLDSLRGQVVVVDFWATWCKPCIDSMPALEAQARRPGVRVLAVNLDDADKAYQMFGGRDLKMTLLAGDAETAQRYAVTTYPHTVVIDRDGIVQTIIRGVGNVGAAVDRIVK
ncbi:MAG: TlpA family protein disulfide reductase [Deltaproteobacteria bacterium]|nr:TlpA family protein disulfide reductase [Deltaproteobacteria bacterium]